MKAVIILAIMAVAVCGTPLKIAPEVLDDLYQVGSANIFVEINAPKILKAMNIPPSNKAQFVHDTLVKHAAATQAPLRDMLNARNAEHESFWIKNVVMVRNVDLALLEEIAVREDVLFVHPDRPGELIEPVENEPASGDANSYEYGVKYIHADVAHGQGILGEGVVVGVLDTGVRVTHEAVAHAYRGAVEGTNQFNFYNPGKRDTDPNDGQGHGTHCTGTIVGTIESGVGVAPGAQFIACMGCTPSGSCPRSDLLNCGQFMACPYDGQGNEDCSKHPDIVSNSWGGGSGDTFYLDLVDAWVSAGILPVFAMGNSGSRCGTANSPGDYAASFAVGAIDSNYNLASFSSRGPGTSRPSIADQNPDVSAPGVNVRSAYKNSDTEYRSLSGTSMACPHVAGATALYLSKFPDASITEIEDAFTASSSHDVGRPGGSPTTCGGKGFDVFPNYFYGSGLIQVDAAIEHGKKLRGMA